MAWRDVFWTMRVMPGDREAIAALAQREGVSASEAVRIALRRVLQESEHPRSGKDGADARSVISGTQ
jgi:hypothetical protein